MNISPRSEHITVKLPDNHGSVTLHILDWGAATATQTVICVHGLTRNAHDFDWVARALVQKNLRVLAVDMPGRGNSPWLEDKMRYGYPLYVAAMTALLDNFHLRQVDWLGTSMGGIIGMMIAATQPQRIKRLILNDIGTTIDAHGLRRIMHYVDTMPRAFTDSAAAEAYLRSNFAAFGIEEDIVWRAIIESSLEQTATGLRLKTDPDIILPMRRDTKDFMEITDVNLSGFWEAIRARILILRGENSDILSDSTLKAMLASNIRATASIIPGCGHAPSLTSPAQIEIVQRFFTTHPTDIALPL